MYCTELIQEGAAIHFFKQGTILYYIEWPHLSHYNRLVVYGCHSTVRSSKSAIIKLGKMSRTVKQNKVKAILINH